MKLIVGLGNPGKQYELTPHNAGFHAVDVLAARHGGEWALERRFEAFTTEIRLGGNKVVLMKPITYMNLSGKSVGAWRAKNGSAPGEVLAVCDDVHLTMGQLRIRANGTHGGQKGLLSMINSLNSLEFPRLRIGVRPQAGEPHDRVEYVLRVVHPAERDAFKESWEDAADAMELLVEQGLAAAMNKFNRKPGEKT